MRDKENRKYIKLGITGVTVVAAGLLGYFLLSRFRAIAVGFERIVVILKPFIYGAILAYILAPLCNRFERLITKLLPMLQRKRSLVSGLSILLSLALALALTWVLVMLVLPQVWDSVVSIADLIPGELTDSNAWLHELLDSQPELQAYWDEFSGKMSANIAGWLKTDLLPTMESMVNNLGSQLATFFIIVKNLFLGVLISVYFLASRRQFATQGKMLLNGAFPRRWADIVEEEIRYADKMFNGFLMGKLLDSAIIGAICFAVTTVLGFNSAALISVVVGVTNIIPFFGPFIGAIPCALLLLLDNPLHCVYFLVFIVILQQLDGNIIGPKILGNTTGLSSFWVLFAILLFGGVWGVIGMIVAVPLFAVIYDIVRRLTYCGLRRHGRGDLIEAHEGDCHPVSEVNKPSESESKDG